MSKCGKFNGCYFDSQGTYDCSKDIIESFNPETCKIIGDPSWNKYCQNGEAIMNNNNECVTRGAPMQVRCDDSCCEDIKDVKDVKDSKDANDIKDVKDIKDGKDGKDANDIKDVKDIKDIKDIKDGKDANDIKDVKDGKKSNNSRNSRVNELCCRSTKDITTIEKWNKFLKAYNTCANTSNIKKCLQTKTSLTELEINTYMEWVDNPFCSNCKTPFCGYDSQCM